MKKLKEIIKRENRDRVIPLLLLLFAVGVQVPLYLYGGGMCKCGYMKHFNPGDYIYPINIIIAFLMLSFPIIITGSSYLYLKSNGYKKQLITTLSSITLLLCIFDMVICGISTIIAVIFFLLIIIQSLLNFQTKDDTDIPIKKKQALIGSQIFAVIFFGSAALETLRVDFIPALIIIISIMAIYTFSRFEILKNIKKVSHEESKRNF